MINKIVAKLIQNRIITEVTQKDISSIILSSDFNIGAELEFIAKRYIDIDDNNSRFKKDLDAACEGVTPKFLRWKVTSDSSIITNKEFDVDSGDENEETTELITPVYSLPDFLLIMPFVLNLIKKYGYTNDSCGLHIGISSDRFDVTKIDLERFAYAQEEGDIIKDMPSRTNLDTARPLEIKRKKYWSTPGSKYQTLRLHPATTHGSYFELRHMGGENYEYMWPTVRKKILKTVAILQKVQTNAEYMRKKQITTQRYVSSTVALSSKDKKVLALKLLKKLQSTSNEAIISLLKRDDIWFDILKLGKDRGSVSEYIIFQRNLKKQYDRYCVQFVVRNYLKLDEEELQFMLRNQNHFIIDSDFELPEKVINACVNKIKNRSVPPWVNYFIKTDLRHISAKLDRKDKDFLDEVLHKKSQKRIDAALDNIAASMDTERYEDY